MRTKNCDIKMTNALQVCNAGAYRAFYHYYFKTKLKPKQMSGQCIAGKLPGVSGQRLLPGDTSADLDYDVWFLFCVPFGAVLGPRAPTKKFPGGGGGGGTHKNVFFQT